MSSIPSTSQDTIGGYAVPIDPMDMMQCDSCQ
jgi:hypothetical protein